MKIVLLACVMTIGLFLSSCSTKTVTPPTPTPETQSTPSAPSSNARDQQATGEMCGGIAGFTCASPDDVCSIEAQMGCGYADQSGICVTLESYACIALYAPVCGCNGQTYENSCYAGLVGSNIDYIGECK